MLVEGVGKVTFVNGILRLETMQINAGGELEGNGCIEIPGNRVGPVIDLIANATKQISEKMEDSSQANGSSEKPEAKDKRKITTNATLLHSPDIKTTTSKA